MQSELPFFLLIFFGLGLMFTHALKKEKRLINYLVAIFCASLCMVAAQNLSADSLGPYQYIIGLATCATCNVVWLIARTLFRQQDPIGRRHVALAMVIAGLVIFNQTWHLLVAIDIQNILSTQQMLRLKGGMNEITTLLSSSILALSFWEALRNFKLKSKTQKTQSVVFAFAFFFGVFNSAVLPKFLFTATQIEQYFPWIMVSSALVILAAIQFVVYAQAKAADRANCKGRLAADTSIEIALEKPDDVIDFVIITGIQRLITEEQMYLTSNLKIANLAQALNASEYKISKAIRSHFNVANFNLFVNQYRVEHAQKLLLGAESQQWSILVIALESGFSSLGTFNRVFKAISGQMPNEFRKQAKFEDAVVS